MKSNKAGGLGDPPMEIIGRLFEKILSHKTDDDPYIETLDRLERARVDLMNVENYVKDRIKTFNNIKEYLPKEHIFLDIEIGRAHV